MNTLKMKAIKDMKKDERSKKIAELKLELIKSKTNQKGKIKTKEIKKAIARILTFNTSENKGELNKK